MGTSAVIVAIPRQDDYVWKVSSEKIPHLTLLFLGDQVENAKLQLIAQFLEHAAATSIHRFGLSVDRRGELGDKNADVLFFDNYGIKAIKEFRSFLLANDTISEAYNSTEQYPSWTPHLTLGYPETPAKTTDRDYGISYVEFDRVALWVGDFEGPEFRLKDYEMSEEVSMSVLSDFEKVLAHYGVKGQRWGIRKPPGSPPGPAEKILVKPIAGKGIKTAGGKNQPISEDAIKAAVYLQKAKASSTASLSNNELKTLNERLQLEQKYRQLVPPKKNTVRRGQDFTKEILNVGATVNEAMNFARSPAGQALKKTMSK